MLVLKNIQVCPRLSGLLAMRIMEKEILESCPGIRGCRRVRGALPCSREPNITDLVLCVGCNRLVWEFVYHCLVRFDCHLGNVLFLARETNVKLRTRCVFPIWRSTDNVRENRHCPIQRVPIRDDAQNFLLFASQIHFADAKLRFDCFIEVRVAGIFFYQEPIRIRRAEIVVHLFLQLRPAIEGTRGKSIFGMASHDLCVRTNRSFKVAFLFRTLRSIIQLQRRLADLLFPGSDELGLFASLKDHCCRY